MVPNQTCFALNKKKSTVGQLIGKDEIISQKLFMADKSILRVYRSNRSMLRVNFDFLYCFKSITVVALLMPY